MKKQPMAGNGLLDLSGWDFFIDGNLRLDGTWEFYWNRLLGPENFINREEKIKPTGFFTVPGSWKDYSTNEKTFNPHGYATYRLIIKNADNRLIYGLIMPDTGTANRVYINGKLFTSSGVPGTSKKESKPQYINRYAYFRVNGSEIAIIVQVSNFHYWKGGIWKNVILGEAESISFEIIKGITIDLILIGALAVMGLYHFSLFILIKKNPSTLYYSLFCFIIVARIIVTGDILLTQIFPDFNWEILIKLEICPFSLGLYLFTLYIFNLFPQIIPVFFVKISRYYMIIFMPVLILMPAEMYSNLIIFSQVFIIIFTFAELVFMIKGLFQKMKGSLIIITGFVILFITIVNDSLYSNLIIHTFNMIPAGVFIFFFSQSFLISIRLFRGFNKKDRLLGDLYMPFKGV